MVYVYQVYKLVPTREMMLLMLAIYVIIGTRQDYKSNLSFRLIEHVEIWYMPTRERMFAIYAYNRN